MISDQHKPTSRHQRNGGMWVFFGFLGRIFLNWFHRRQNQMAFAGRLIILGFRGATTPSRKKLIKTQVFEEISNLTKSSIGLIVILGLMMGILWTSIWFGALSQVGGSETILIPLLFTVHIQEITPILTTIVIILRYSGPMSLEVAIMKSTRQFETLARMGIPPEHLVAWPRLIGPVLSYPILLFLMSLSSLIGAYLGIWQAIDLSWYDFYMILSNNVEAFSFFKLATKSLLISFAMCFFCIYNGWLIEEGQIDSVPKVTRQAMGESFFFSTLAGVLVTVLYA